MVYNPTTHEESFYYLSYAFRHFYCIVLEISHKGRRIVFEKVVNDTVFVHQDLRGAANDWFYWAFRVRGAQGRKLTFVFTKSDVVGLRGPVISVDKGRTYDYLAEKGAGKRTFTYEFGDNDREVWFYECFPYTPKMWETFMKSSPKGLYEKEVLCRSRKGRKVPLYRIYSGTSGPKLSVVVSSRIIARKPLQPTL